MRAFFEMGGYWPYVWSAWGLGVILLAGLYAVSARQTRRLQRMLGDLRRASPRAGAWEERR